MIDWNPVSTKPLDREPLLLCCADVQEAQVGWLEDDIFWRWRNGQRAKSMSGVTHWALIDWPACSPLTQNWRRTFEMEAREAQP